MGNREWADRHCRQGQNIFCPNSDEANRRNGNNNNKQIKQTNS
jgi:hypothetical protein